MAGRARVTLDDAVFDLEVNGTADIPLKIGCLTFGICLIAAFAAFTTRETYRIRLADLGDRNAVPVPLAEYERARGELVKAIQAAQKKQ